MSIQSKINKLLCANRICCNRIANALMKERDGQMMSNRHFDSFTFLISTEKNVHKTLSELQNIFSLFLIEICCTERWKKRFVLNISYEFE